MNNGHLSTCPAAVGAELCECGAASTRSYVDARNAITASHNRLAGEIVARIVKETFTAGGDAPAVFVLLESVITGVILSQLNIGGDHVALDLLMKGVRQRLAEIRLKNAMPRGAA